MTKKIQRKLNGRPEIVVVSDAKADTLISKGWTLVADKAPEDKSEEPKPAKRGPKPKKD